MNIQEVKRQVANDKPISVDFMRTAVENFLLMHGHELPYRRAIREWQDEYCEAMKRSKA